MVQVAIRPCKKRRHARRIGVDGDQVRLLADLNVDDVPFSPPMHLKVFWDVYDGHQTVTCHEGQALEFVPRSRALQLAVPEYLVNLWDLALSAWRDGHVQ